MSTIVINEREYELATTLRVAYKVQGENNHRSYVEVFQEIGSMTIEQQVAIIYCAFQVKNPEDAKEITKQKFLDYFLDNYDVSMVMELLEAIINGIMGKDLVDKADQANKASGTATGNA